MIDLSFMKQAAVVVNLPDGGNRISGDIQEMKRYGVVELTSESTVSEPSTLKCSNITLLRSQYDYYSSTFFGVNSSEDRMFILRSLDRNLRCRVWINGGQTG